MRGQWCSLRPLVDSDAQLTFNWRHLERAALLSAPPIDLEDQRAWIRSRPSSEENYVICLSDGLPVGTIAITEINPYHQSAQTSRFLIGEEDAVTGRPIAIEAMTLCYEKIFEDWGYRKVWGYVTASNTRMIRWQESLGMSREGLQQQQLLIGGRVEDAVLLGMTRDRYFSFAKPRMMRLLHLMGKNG